MSWFERFRRRKFSILHTSACKVTFAVVVVSGALTYLAIALLDGFAVVGNSSLLLTPVQAFILFVAIFVAVAGLALLLLTAACEVSRSHLDKRGAEFAYDQTTQFFAIVSHQLRSPLSAIRWLTEVLRSEAGPKLNDNEIGYVDDIHDQAKQMIKLVNALLSMTGMELGRIKPHAVPVNVFTLLQSVVQEQRKRGTKSLATLVLRKPKVHIPATHTDRDLLKQIFINIIGNAVRYTKGGRGSVEVALDMAGSQGIVVSVKDQGIGIPAESQQHIFEKFYRAPNATKVQTEGSGLGLYICKLIAELLGCKIWFTSEEGKGSTFYVQIPVR